MRQELSTPLYRNRRDAKLAGVCSGLADRFGIDPLWIRLGMVTVTVLGAFPWTLIAYGAAAWLMPVRDAAAETL